MKGSSAEGVSVRASNGSLWGSLLIPALGVANVAIALAMLTGRTEPTSLLRGERAQIVMLAVGVALTAYGVLIVVKAWRGRRMLLNIDEQRVRVFDWRGAVELRIDQVVLITTKRRGSRWLPDPRQQHLQVFTIDGGRYTPMLQPEGSDWPTVAREFNKHLTEYRALRGLPPVHEP